MKDLYLELLYLSGGDEVHLLELLTAYRESISHDENLLSLHGNLVDGLISLAQSTEKVSQEAISLYTGFVAKVNEVGSGAEIAEAFLGDEFDTPPFRGVEGEGYVSFGDKFRSLLSQSLAPSGSNLPTVVANGVSVSEGLAQVEQITRKDFSEGLGILRSFYSLLFNQ